MTNMLEDSKYVIPAFMLMLIIGFGGWFYVSVLDPNEGTHNAHNHPDIFVDDVQYQRFNAKGEITSHIQSPVLTYFQTDAKGEMQKPVIKVNQGQEPWTITADKAYSQENGRTITLSGNVKIIQHMQAGERIITTDNLHYYPKRKMAHTDATVFYHQTGISFQGTGMNVYISQQRLELLSKARGSYVPTKKS